MMNYARQDNVVKDISLITLIVRTKFGGKKNSKPKKNNKSMLYGRAIFEFKSCS